MTTITNFMTDDHRRCDDLLATAEQHAQQEDWAAAAPATLTFIDAIEHHFQMEEQVLFPEFERQTGMNGGPTYVMREEHRQMRDLIAQLRAATDAHNRDDYLDTTETLLIMIQQHNMKEEGMLYPFTDERLSNVAEVIGAMGQVAA
ncbi:MAG: hemerythrin domain-containing protein [Gammaproteobacteria bacterium]|nr:hemerythrin domain-containing protein [Gammaproteobacteria bacterium]